jgi:hypothetical protein
VAMASEKEAVAQQGWKQKQWCSGDRNRGSDSGNIEAAEPSGRKIGSGGGGGGGRNKGSGCSSGDSGNGARRQQQQQQGQATMAASKNRGSSGVRQQSTRERQH